MLHTKSQGLQRRFLKVFNLKGAWPLFWSCDQEYLCKLYFPHPKVFTWNLTWKCWRRNGPWRHLCTNQSLVGLWLRWSKNKARFLSMIYTVIKIVLFLKSYVWVLYKEPPHWDSSFEYTKQMVELMDKKIFTILRHMKTDHNSSSFQNLTRGLGVMEHCIELLGAGWLKHFALYMVFIT